MLVVVVHSYIYRYIHVYAVFVFVYVRVLAWLREIRYVNMMKMRRGQRTTKEVD